LEQLLGVVTDGRSHVATGKLDEAGAPDVLG
jgi:hypothetical protein